MGAVPVFGMFSGVGEYIGVELGGSGSVAGTLSASCSGSEIGSGIGMLSIGAEVFPAASESEIGCETESVDSDTVCEMGICSEIGCKTGVCSEIGCESVCEIGSETGCEIGFDTGSPQKLQNLALSAIILPQFEQNIIKFLS